MKDLASFEQDIARKLRPWFLQDIKLHHHSDCLTTAINRHPQLLCIMNHGGFYGPWAAALAYHYLFLNHGGGNRKPTGIAWRGFYKLPIYKQITEYLTQTASPLDYQACKSLMSEKVFNDMIILPEGTNCHYFDGHTLQPFISPRFIELSIETQTPLLLFIHQGSEHWSIPVNIPKLLMPLVSMLPRRYKQGLERSKLINIPHMLKGSIPELNVVCKLYQPSIHPSALRDKAFSRKLIEQESLKIRSMMQGYYSQLKQEHDSLKEESLENAYAPDARNELTHPCVEVA